VEGPSRDLRSLVIKRSDESRDRLFVDQAIEEVHTESPDDGFLMPKSAPDGC
jgi:hypothetical protein